MTAIYKRVYASPSKRDLKSKGEEEMITYPNIYFTVDDFDEVINQFKLKIKNKKYSRLSMK